jgi:NAD(P)-dependent dehydrogenase (short-subunit alcohol dehydrogenase family)
MAARGSRPSADQEVRAVAVSFRLDGRGVLVTGGSRGIGRAIATALAAEGAQVAVNARTADACQEVVQEIQAQGGKALGVPGDVGRADDCRRIVEAVIASWGRLDVLVNNAATSSQFGLLLDVEEPDLDRIWEVNVKGPWRLCRLAVEAWMGEHGGSIVNVASVGGIRGDPMIGAYSASKAALISITRSLARELGPRGIRVNAIAPDLIRTEFARVLVETPQIRTSSSRRRRCGRVGEPEEIAGTAVLLASDAASFITGSVLVVDGGNL